MEIINIKGLVPVDLNCEICAAVGNFDGVHLGHQKLIDVCMNQSMKSAVLTFYPHPNTFIRNLPGYEILTSIEVKKTLMEKKGLDYLIIVEFSDELAHKDKNDFIQFMHQMNIKKIVCGYDFTFGYKALGTSETLKEEFDTIVVPKYVLNDVRVSTTHIKDLLRQGDLALARTFLGRNHIVYGTIVYGKHIGTCIGFPTANIDYKDSLLPKNGVYFVKVVLKDKDYYGMANIGYNPTVDYTEERKFEVHIFDFDKNIYSDSLFVEFLERIRPEKKYASKEDLSLQLKKDKEFCMKKIENLIELD